MPFNLQHSIKLLVFMSSVPFNLQHGVKLLVFMSSICHLLIHLCLINFDDGKKKWVTTVPETVLDTNES